MKIQKLKQAAGDDGDGCGGVYDEDLPLWYRWKVSRRAVVMVC